LLHFGPSETIQFLIWQSLSKLLSKMATQCRPFYFFGCIDYNMSLYLHDLLNSMIKKNSFINISDNLFELHW
jgi:hypothetical protein